MFPTLPSVCEDVYCRPLKRQRNETLDISDGRSMAEKEERIVWSCFIGEIKLQIPSPAHASLASTEGGRLTGKKSWTREVLELGTLAVAESGC